MEMVERTPPTEDAKRELKNAREDRRRRKAEAKALREAARARKLASRKLPPPKPAPDQKATAWLTTDTHLPPQKRAGRQKRRIEERLKERQWPLDAATGRRADIDPDDVLAPLPEEVPELTAEQIAEAASAPSAFATRAIVRTDDDLSVSRRKAAERARVARASVRGPEWTEQLVEARMDEAFRTLFRTADRHRGPRQFGNAMPAIVREMSDLVAQAGNRSLRKAIGRLIRSEGPPSTEEVRRMEDALAWSARYLSGLPTDLPMFVNLGSMWRAWGVPISKKCVQLGVQRQTFYRQRKEAVKVIVEGLKRDGRAPT